MPPKPLNLAKRSTPVKRTGARVEAASHQRVRVLFTPEESAFVEKHGKLLKSKGISPRAQDNWIDVLKLEEARVLQDVHRNGKSCSDHWRVLHKDD